MDSDLNELEKEIAELTLRKKERLSELDDCVQKLNQLVRKYKIHLNPESTLNELIGLENKLHRAESLIKTESINKIRRSLSNLSNSCQEFEDKGRKLREEIFNLWTKFYMSNDHVIEYLVSNEIDADTLRILQVEYDRCMKEKSFKICEAIIRIREEIGHLWKNCLFDGGDKLDFIEFFNQQDNLDENLLDKHREYFIKLKEYYEKNKHLFAVIEQWLAKWVDFQVFDVRIFRFDLEGKTILK